MNDILIEEHKGLAQIRLNRPDALNALSLEMIREIRTALKDFAEDKNIKAVLLTSDSEKAFCAGGDVKAVAVEAQRLQQSGGDLDGLCHDIFFEEYNLNLEIHNFPKPVVSLVSGICMGGGAGISLHGDFMVTSEKTRFAMPEVFIGFFPDVGSGYIFNSLPRPLALWLLLTGSQISGTEMFEIGLATHYIESRGMQALEKSLLNSDWQRSEAISILKSQLATYCEPPHETIGRMKEITAKAEEFFDKANIAEIMIGLEKSAGNDFADTALSAMKKASPLSLVLTMQHMDWARGKPIEEVMEHEFRLSQYFMRQPDFYEGVRAVLIDKTKNPDWQVPFEDIEEGMYRRIQEGYAEMSLEK